MEDFFSKYLPKLQRTFTKLVCDFVHEIDRGRSRLISIKGARGVGKTTLVLQYLKQVALPTGQSLYDSTGSHADIQTAGSLERLPTVRILRYFLENIVKMSYDGSIKDSGKAVGKANDEGIYNDIHIHERSEGVYTAQ